MHAELLDDDDFAEAPADSSLAFVFLEARARKRMRENASEAGDSESTLDCYLEYVTAVIAIAGHYNISGVSGTLPSPQSFSFAQYQHISQAITAKVYQIKATNADNHRSATVELSEGDRRRIQDKVGKLRIVIKEGSLEENRKIKLNNILDEFDQELTKQRTNFSKFLHMGLVLAAIHGSAGFVEDATKLYDGAIKVLGVAKLQEDDRHVQLQLQPPQKQLPAPEAKPQEPFDLDDEIPF